ncbi:MAG: YkgJ family cysteine cluster protein [Deltaproteobacteria bacterium]|nr:YkgJ family cysteine cluster protein [Deltaproteobacteria bacterium]
MIDKRIRALVDELVADKGYVTGRRSFPRTVTDDDAVAITASLHAALDDATAVRAQTIKRRHLTLACSAGCASCCDQLVMVYRPEVLRIARWLDEPASAAIKAQFLEAYAAWQARVGDTPARLKAALARGDYAAYDEAFFAHWRAHIACAFNQGGLCTIYDVRPLSCRDAHAVGTSAHCTGESREQTPGMHSPDHDRWLEGARAALRATHHAIGGAKEPPTALCDAVAALLASTPATSNV